MSNSDSDDNDDEFVEAKEGPESNAPLPCEESEIRLFFNLDEENEVKADLDKLEASSTFLPPRVYDVIVHLKPPDETISDQNASSLTGALWDVVKTLSASSFINYLAVRYRDTLEAQKSKFLNLAIEEPTGKNVFKNQDDYSNLLAYFSCKFAEHILLAIAQIVSPVSGSGEKETNRLDLAAEVFKLKLLPMKASDDARELWKIDDKTKENNLEAPFVYELTVHYLLYGIPSLFENVKPPLPEKPLINWFSFSHKRQSEMRCVDFNGVDWNTLSPELPVVPMPRIRAPYDKDLASFFMNKLFYTIYQKPNDWENGVGDTSGDLKFFFLNPMAPPRFLFIACGEDADEFSVSAKLRGPFSTRPCANGVTPSYQVVAFLYEKENNFHVGRWYSDGFVGVEPDDDEIVIRYLFVERCQ